MSGGIYLLRGDDDLVEMNEAPYDSEDVLQTLLAKYPSLLAGGETTVLSEQDGAAPRTVKRHPYETEVHALDREAEPRSLLA